MGPNNANDSSEHLDWAVAGIELSVLERIRQRELSTANSLASTFLASRDAEIPAVSTGRIGVRRWTGVLLTGVAAMMLLTATALTVILMKSSSPLEVSVTHQSAADSATPASMANQPARPHGHLRAAQIQSSENGSAIELDSGVVDGRMVLSKSVRLVARDGAVLLGG